MRRKKIRMTIRRLRGSGKRNCWIRELDPVVGEASFILNFLWFAYKILSIILTDIGWSRDPLSASGLNIISRCIHICIFII